MTPPYARQKAAPTRAAFCVSPQFVAFDIIQDGCDRRRNQRCAKRYRCRIAQCLEPDCASQATDKKRHQQGAEHHTTFWARYKIFIPCEIAKQSPAQINPQIGRDASDMRGPNDSARNFGDDRVL